MSLPSLPLIDGCFIFDNSSIEKLQSCPYEYQLCHINKRISADNRAGLNFGQACHSVLKHRYMTYGSNPVTDTTETNHILAEHFDASPEPVGDFRNLSMAQAWSEAYNDVYKTESFEILKLSKGELMVERSFLRPFAFFDDGHLVDVHSVQFEKTTVAQWVEELKCLKYTPILFSGRIDMGLTDTTGEWILDHKSTFQFGKSFISEMLASPQFRGYAWEFKHYFGRMPKGYIINAFRVRPPCKGAEYDTSLLFRTSGKDPDFLRISQHLTEADITEWEQNTFNMLEEIFWYHGRGKFHKHKKSCVSKYGPCQFYTLCNEVAPESRESYLNSANYIDNTWTPLNTPKMKD